MFSRQRMVFYSKGEEKAKKNYKNRIKKVDIELQKRKEKKGEEKGEDPWE